MTFYIETRDPSEFFIPVVQTGTTFTQLSPETGQSNVVVGYERELEVSAIAALPGVSTKEIEQWCLLELVNTKEVPYGMVDSPDGNKQAQALLN